jgi:hypothetical protein
MRRHSFSFRPQFMRKLREIVFVRPFLSLAMTKLDVMLNLNASDFGFNAEVVESKEFYGVGRFHDLSASRCSFSDLNIALNTSGLVLSGRFKLIVYDSFRSTLEGG